MPLSTVVHDGVSDRMPVSENAVRVRGNTSCWNPGRIRVKPNRTSFHVIARLQANVERQVRFVAVNFELGILVAGDMIPSQEGVVHLAVALVGQ